MFGPILVLKWYGKVLPCFEKEEDRNARLAVQAISNAHVLSLPVTKSSSSSFSSSAAFSLGGLFRSKSQSTGQDPSETNQNNSSTSNDNNHNTVARLVLQDSLDEAAQPELILESTSSTAIIARVPLRKIHTVMLEPSTGHVVLSGKKPMHNNNKNDAVNELLRLSVVAAPTTMQQSRDNSAEMSIIPATNDERNMLVHHLMVLIEWERQRRAALGLDDDDDDDQDNFIQARARKAAHFAKRELELQQVKRDRDKRKAKLVAEAGGGLKYTALAMANRGMD